MIELTAAERVLIRKVCRIQINSLKKIYNNNLTLMQMVKKAQWGVDEEFWEEVIIAEVETFEEVAREPGYIFDLLDMGDIDSVKHILREQCRLYVEPKRRLEERITLFEQMNKNLN